MGIRGLQRRLGFYGRFRGGVCGVAYVFQESFNVSMHFTFQRDSGGSRNVVREFREVSGAFDTISEALQSVFRGVSGGLWSLLKASQGAFKTITGVSFGL